MKVYSTHRKEWAKERRDHPEKIHVWKKSQCKWLLISGKENSGFISFHHTILCLNWEITAVMGGVSNIDF